MAYYGGNNKDAGKEETDLSKLLTRTDEEEDQIAADILDSLFAGEDDILEEEIDETEETDEEEETAGTEESEIEEEEDTYETQEADPGEEREESAMAAEPGRAQQEGTTVITKGTTINGSIIADCSLDVMGTIIGNIECLGKLTIFGKVTGNSMASEVFVDTDRLEGSINSEGSVKVAQQTVVIGDVTASSGMIAGAVKGNLDVSGPLVIDSTAVVQGDIKVKSIQINNGAVVDGHVSLDYATGIDLNNIFEAK